MADFTALRSRGWHLLGAYPDGQEDDVGSWILAHNGEAALLELPPGRDLEPTAQAFVESHDLSVRYVMTSHSHVDHWDEVAWERMKTKQTWKNAAFLNPVRWLRADVRLELGGEPLWRVHAPKHSPDDAVTIFRGIAMTGDIELQQVASCNREVAPSVKRASMAYFAGFEKRTEYRVERVISAHLNDDREGVPWRELFAPRD